MRRFNGMLLPPASLNDFVAFAGKTPVSNPVMPLCAMKMVIIAVGFLSIIKVKTVFVDRQRDCSRKP
ncbi:hypothetical protein WBG78_05815 [Chryseolinea sp. T2]|uniref:hypothetical protein n=1 Tax=Chryseolinea sp. T2 TaxID=3129255 RepID=UPI003076FCA0